MAATFKRAFRQDLTKPLRIYYNLDLVFSKDNLANEIQIELFDGDTAFSGGGSVSGTVIRADGGTIPINGTISGNVVTVALTEACMEIPGTLQVYVKLTSGNIKTTIFAGVFTAIRTETSTVIDPGTIIPSITELINQIDAAIDSIPADYSALLGSVAGTYSASKTYAVGDYVWYNGQLYRCSTAITTAEAWTAAHWTAAVLSGDVTGLKSALTLKVDKDLMQKCELIDIPASANKFDLSTAKVGYLHTNGNVYTGGNYDNYKYNSLGSVSVGDVIKSWKYTNGTVSAQSMQMAVAYDSNGDVMSSAGKSSVSEYTVPNGVASVSVTFSNLQLNENVMVTINGETPTQFIPYVGANQYYQATKAFLPSDTFDDVVSIDGVNQVTAQNAQFIFTSANLFDESTVTDGYFVNQVTGELNESATNSVSDFIPVIANSVYTLSMALSRQIRFFWYDADKNPIPGSGALTSEITEISITSPANAAFIRFSTSGIYTALIQFEKGATATEYTKFGTAYLLPQYAPPADMALNLPDKIYALVGYELNIYFENIAENWENYTWDVSCAKGMQLERGYRVTPEAADVGTYPLVIIAKSGNMEVNKTANLIITSATAGSGDTTSLIVLGDSTTASGIAITKLNENFSDDVMSISTLGTRGTAPNNHEGRSGWTFNAYFNPPNDADVALGIENPWYNPTTHTFDANYYFTTTGIAKPDWLFINLGINDTFSYTNDAALLSAITTIKGQCDSMIASILSASPSTKIGLCLTIPPNDSQDAFGKAYKTMQTRDRYKRNNFIWVHDLIETYGDRESESIYLVPIFTNLDTVYNMGLESNLVNSRNSITYESPIGNGGVHPAESGYWQIADVYTAFLKAQA